MKYFSLIILTVLLTSCSGFRTVGNTSTVPAGTEVDFNKLMNPSFAEDYSGADIITFAEFYAPNPSNMLQTKVPKDHIVFQVVPIGQEATNSPMGGDKIGNYVFIPKSFADIIFDFKKGDKVELRGGTRIRKSIIPGLAKIVEFKATSIKKK